ncbi:MAG: DUF4037 domain-containing protein [Lachnospiraceae bacterium]|nr:DUF4037 domain-containing protein [Lachnospiraceae bacterium]
MTGLELSKAFYEEYGKPMLSQFSEVRPYLAVGFVGSGSEHYGFDDEVSQDHDFEPGFCIFLPGEDIVDRRQAFLLERAYAKLPKEFRGFIRSGITPVGGARCGVIRTADFYQRAVGSPDGELTVGEWLQLPDYALAEAVNGEVFDDFYGEFSTIREKLQFMPEDVKLKRLAGQLLLMAQAGQYNYRRCLQHGEPEAAQLACVEFVQAAMKAYFLLNDRYMPYYKWSFRALREIYGGEALAEKLSKLLLGPWTESYSENDTNKQTKNPTENDTNKQTKSPAESDTNKHSENYTESDTNSCTEAQYLLIESIASDFITLLQERNLTDAVCGDLEKHAYSVNDLIEDPEVRNLHILAAV